MPILVALLSLLGGCSSMLDLPDQPRVSMEATAPLEPQGGHGEHDGAGAWREARSWQGAPGDDRAESVGWRASDAGTTAEAVDGGAEVRLSAR